MIEANEETPAVPQPFTPDEFKTKHDLNSWNEADIPRLVASCLHVSSIAVQMQAANQQLAAQAQVLNNCRMVLAAHLKSKIGPLSVRKDVLANLKPTDQMLFDQTDTLVIVRMASQNLIVEP